MLIDAFSDGFVARNALKEKKDVYCLVGAIEEVEVLHSNLLEHAKSIVEIGEWAKIPAEKLQIDSVAQPMEEERFCPTNGEL